MNDFFSNKLRLLKFILLSIALGNFFISEGYATTKSVVITQQEKTVKGKVTDDNDEPLIGVSVRVAGTSAGTVTDSDGMFQLNVAGTDVLEFSYVGYKTVKVIAGNKPFLSVILKEDQEILDEIVVVGYGTKRKGSIAAAVTTIGTEDIARTTSSTVSGALVGKIAGITTRQKSGQPGSGPSIQIRNMGTPLFVIDGIIKDEAQFNNLDVNDIENISILKDGAAAIYGVKAANGVVLVTTKNGSKNQKAAVTLDFNYSWQSWTSYPRMLNAYEWQYANYMKEANLGTLSVSPDVARAELEKWRTGYYNPETGEDYRGFDWGDNYVSNAAPQSYIHANLSGGGNKTTYYLSISNIDQDAVFKDYNFQRTNIQSNFNIDISEKLKLGFRLNGRLENRTNPALPGSDDYANARQAVFNLPPIYRPYANDNPNYLNNVPGASGLNLAALTTDNAGKSDNNTTVVQIDWDMEWKTPIKGLTGKGIFSYWTSQNKVNNLEKGWKEYTYDRAADEYIVAYDKSAANETWMERFDTTIKEFSGQFLLNYDNMFGKHHVTGVGGFEFTKRDYHSLNVQQHPVENEFIDLISTNDNNLVSENKAITSTASWVFRAGYDYENRYILDLSARYDGSWKFPKGNRWGFFPSVSAAWRISEENFFKNSSISSWFSNLKLRASYGMMGDDNLGGLYPDFAYLSGYTYYKGQSLMPDDPFSSVKSKKVIGSAPKGIPVTTISWMKIKLMNVGIDFGFFDNRLTGEFDLFKRMRDGIPGTPSDIMFPLETGLSALPENMNSDMTVGFDAFVKWNDKVGDLKYSVGANITFARQKNGKRHGEIFGNAWDKYRWAQSNRWSNVVLNTDQGNAGGVWMWEVIGRFETQEQIDSYPVDQDGQNNATVRPGDVILRDVNGDGIINDFDERPQAYASADWPWDSSTSNKNPLISMGINVGFEWKGFDVAADFAGGFKNTFVADWDLKWGVTRSVNGYYYNNIDVWRHEDIFDPKSPWIPGKFPALRGQESHSGRWWNSFYTREVNYLRLRNLVVGYSLPKNWIRKVGMEQCRIYFQGTNLFCLSSLHDYGFDPEISTVNGQDYPQHKVLTLGVNVKF